MNKKMILALPPLACLCASATAAPAAFKKPAAAQEKPNVVMILLDDFGYGDLGAFRKLYPGKDNPKLEAWKQTGNLDRFAEEGIRFTRAYTCPWSAPARQMLLSGLWTDRSSIYEQPWIGKRLRDQGYTTGFFGKCHGGKPIQRCYNNTKPETAEFEEGLWFNGGCRKAYVKDGETFKGRKGLGKNYTYTTHKGEHLTDIWNEEAIEFVKRNSGDDKPFFLYLAHTTPHGPLQGAPEDLRATFPKKYGKMTDMEIIDNWRDRKFENEHYTAMIRGIDRTFQDLVNTLEETGELDHTIIVFASDNGNCHSTSYPLHGHKTEAFEGGIRTPLFVWSSKIAASNRSGSVYDGLVSLADFAPTVAAIAGEKPGSYASDGCDIRPYVMSGKPLENRVYFYAGKGREDRLDDYTAFYRDLEPDHKPLMYCTYIKDDQKIVSMQSATKPELHSLTYFKVADASGEGFPVMRMYEKAAPYGEYPGNPEAMELYREMVEMIKASDGDIQTAWSGEHTLNPAWKIPDTYTPAKGWNWSETHKYAERAGVNLHVEVIRNTAFKGQRPAIVFFYGGSWQNGTTNQFRLYAEELAAKGMTAILAEYRTASRGHAQPWQCVEDAKSVMRYVKIHAKELGVNPKKIVASGGSAGGHLAAATAYIQAFDHPEDRTSISAVPAALALFNPVVDNGPEGYGYDRVKDYWEKFSPFYNVKDGNALPTLLMVGDRDKLVPVPMVEAFKQKTEANGAPFTLHIYKGQGHSFFNMKAAGNPYYQQTLENLEDFLSGLKYIN